MRGVAVGILTLIALQVFGSSGGPEAGGKLAGWIATGLKKAISADVAAIPTSKAAKPAAATPPGGTPAGQITLPRNPPLGVQV